MADPPSHFFKFIRPGFKFNLSIPKSFSRNLNNGGLEKATLQRGRREWLVDISDEGVFGDGWSKFVIENGVQEFDFIVFKHQGNMVFDFLVFDQSKCERQCPNLFDEMDVEETPTESDSTYTDGLGKKPVQNHIQVNKETNSTLKKATHLAKNDHRYFISTIKSYFKTSGLYLPIRFMISNGLKVGEMVIRDDKGVSWTVQLKKSGEKSFYLGRGYKEFCTENELKEGDAFKFEVVENEKDKPLIVKFSLIGRGLEYVLVKKGIEAPYFIRELKA